VPQQLWSIGIYGGESPLALAPRQGAVNPVLSAAAVTDVAARFVADPFLVRLRGRWYMFFEVFDDARDKGVIALAESADGLAWEYRGVVLEEPFHLSYPHVVEWQGSFYMTPETLAPAAVRLYRADPFPERWTFAGQLVAGVLADPTPFRFRDRWWMLACSTPWRHRHDTLLLFSAADLAGRWQPHPRNPLVAGDPSRARPAGRVLAWNGRLLRFAQDCSRTYGGAVRALSIRSLTPTDYAEEEATGPLPLLGPGGDAWNRRGMHHCDLHHLPGGGWIAGVDGWREP
jgi:hypothetical protein